MNALLLAMLQPTADQPIKVHHGWNAGWWFWVIIGFLVILTIFTFTRKGPYRR